MKRGSGILALGIALVVGSLAAYGLSAWIDSTDNTDDSPHSRQPEQGSLVEPSDGPPHDSLTESFQTETTPVSAAASTPPDDLHVDDGFLSTAVPQPIPDPMTGLDDNPICDVVQDDCREDLFDVSQLSRREPTLAEASFPIDLPPRPGRQVIRVQVEAQRLASNSVDH